MSNSHLALSALIQRNTAVSPEIRRSLQFLMKVSDPNISVLVAPSAIVNNSTTMVNTDLVLSTSVYNGSTAIRGGATYRIYGLILPVTGAAPGIKVDFGNSTCLASATLGSCYYRLETTNSFLGVISAPFFNAPGASTAAVQAIFIEGQLFATQSGSLGLRFAQNVANASDTRLAAGSWIAALEMPQ